MSPELPESLQVLFRVTDALDEAGVAYHLGGSFASSIHGIPRQTQDINLVLELSVDGVRALALSLQDDFYLDIDTLVEAVRVNGAGNILHLGFGVRVEIFVRGGGAFDLEEFRRSRENLIEVAPGRTIVKTAEDILLRKLQWFRAGGEISDRQWNDVLGVIRTQQDRLDLRYLQHWGHELEILVLLSRALGEASGSS